MSKTKKILTIIGTILVLGGLITFIIFPSLPPSCQSGDHYDGVACVLECPDDQVCTDLYSYPPNEDINYISILTIIIGCIVLMPAFAGKRESNQKGIKQNDPN